MNDEKIENVWVVLFNFICVTFIFGLNISSCSDMPYTGFMLNTADIDKDIVKSDQGNFAFKMIMIPFA